jgi:hypothetical protein
MNLTKRDQNLLLTLLGLIVFFGAYMGIYNNLNSKTEELQAEVSALSPRLSELKGYYDRLPEYQEGIEQSIETVDKELEKYPRDIRPEGILAYVMALENEVGVDISSVEFVPAQLFSRFQLTRPSENGDELVPMAAMQTGFSANCGFNYAQLKRLINYIYSAEHNASLDRISVNYNGTTGELSGSFSVTKYFITSSEYKYDLVELPRVPQGTANPFGTINIRPAENTEPTE